MLTGIVIQLNPVAQGRVNPAGPNPRGAKEGENKMAIDRFNTRSLDGEEWAAAFVAAVKAKTVNPESEEDVRAWFQNAIMAGYDRGMPVNGDEAASRLVKPN